MMMIVMSMCVHVCVCVREREEGGAGGCMHLGVSEKISGVIGD